MLLNVLLDWVCGLGNYEINLGNFSINNIRK